MKTSKETLDKAYGHIPKEVNLSYMALEEPLFPKLNSIIRLIFGIDLKQENMPTPEKEEAWQKLEKKQKNG